MPVSVPVGDGPVEHVEVRRGEYHDSVTLMLAARAVAGVGGVERVLVAMATELNVALLADLGYAAVGNAGPADLVVAFASGSADAEAAALAALADSLVTAASAASTGGAITAPGDAQPDRPSPRTTAAALGRTSAPITLISTPGLASIAEAMEALEYGANPIIFSDNIPIDDEVRLKEEARRRSLLVMGPDCGTVVLHGTGLAFANVTRPGPISLVAASGTGAQQLMALLDAAGTGIRHCLGVGGRDLTEQVAGRSTLAALTALAHDAETELIAVVSKPPHPTVAARVEAHAATLGKPVHFAFVSPDHPTLTETAERILTAVGRGRGAGARWPHWAPAATTNTTTTPGEEGSDAALSHEQQSDATPGREHQRDTAPGRKAVAVPGTAVRGLFSGGTLRAEAEVVLARAGGQAVGSGKSGGWGEGESRKPPTSADASAEPPRPDNAPAEPTADPADTTMPAAAPPAARSAATNMPTAGPRIAGSAATNVPTADPADTNMPAADPRIADSAATNVPTADPADTNMPAADPPTPTPFAFTFNLTDFGDDAYTRGRPHPMIDNTLRLRAVAEAAADAGVGVLLLDVVLGRGAHPDPAGEVAAAVGAAREVRPGLAVVVSLCGTAGDPQGLERQAGVLAGAGAWVFLSNAEAAGAAARLAVGR